MKRRTLFASLAVAGLAAVAGAAFFLHDTDRGGGLQTSSSAAALVRPHSPVLGAADAPVTVVEFFDPSCEGCRAFHPFVKQLLMEYSGRMRVVVRYAPFHKGSDEAVAILEAARAQGRYETVLEALLLRQPEWAVHGAPDLALAWKIAEAAGVDTGAERRRLATESAQAILAQDVADVNAFAIERTPTFFVNGRPLARFHPDELRAEIERALGRARPAPASP